MKRMCVGFLKSLALAIMLLAFGVLIPNSWRATGAEVQCIEREREALLEFKVALGNNSGIFPWSSWGHRHHKRDCCQWEGVFCSNQTGHVLRLHLPGDWEQPSLKGNISASLMELQYLMSFNLSFNQFEDAYIPEFFGSLRNLRYLDLRFCYLVRGNIPSQLGLLSHLQYLDLCGNDYQLGNLSQLQHLDRSWNDLEGTIPYQLGNLSQLQHLDLSYNNLRGAIPYQLGNLSQLQHLDLSWNDLEGTIPYQLGNLSQLQHLDLSQNHLKGLIPYEFGSMMNSLENLDLSYNQLKGRLKSLGNICTLHSLSLHDNYLSENLPTILQTLSGCARYSLQYLDLSCNQITGSLLNLSTFTSLELFDISSNLLNGTISTNLRFPSSLVTLDITNNFLRGVLTDSHFANMPNLKTLDLTDNSLALRFSHNWVPPFQLQAIYLRSCKLGPGFPKWLLTQNNFIGLDISDAGISDTIPGQFWGMLTPELQYLNVSYNHFFGTIPNVPKKFTEVCAISLASNHFEGPIPQFLRNAGLLFLSNNNFIELHPFLCANRATQMLVLDLSHNQLFGQLSNCWNHFKSLDFLDLSNNNLFGEFPASIGSIQSLQALILRNNGFTGELPITLRSCSELILLDAGENKFAGHVPSWLGVGLQQLEILILRNNNFSGSLSTHLCYLSSLHFLDLSMNNLSGPILKCFKNFTPMALENSTSLQGLAYTTNVGVRGEWSYELSAWLTWKGTERLFKNNLFLNGIDLSSNQLNGGIPTELGILVGMVSLNLSRNQLHGKIPTEIGGLTSLDLLDLSRNHFIGSIPSSLALIDRLGMLDLSYNNLSGKIPIGTQLQSFDSSSYEGNPNLCGKPLEKKCPEENKRNEPVEFQQEKHSILSKEFYWSMTFGFIIGFWGIFGSILFSRSLRHAYFNFLNNLTDTTFVLVTLTMTKCIRWLKGYLEKHG